MRLLYFISILILLSGCLFVRPKYVRYGIRQIDTLSTMLQEIEQRLMVLDTNHLRKTYKQYQQSITLLQHIQDTSFSQDEWQILTLYGQIRKPLRNYIHNFPQFYKELDYSQKQISSLRHDLKKRKIKRSDFEKYIETEKEAISRFYESFLVYTNDIESKLKLFDSLYPQIQVIMRKHISDEYLKNISYE